MSAGPIKSSSQGALWYNFLWSLMVANKGITIPTGYRAKVQEVKAMFENDPSGLAGTLADFMITAATPKYKVITEHNSNLEEILNDTFDDLNAGYNQVINTGLGSLAKEYFRERWKGSSHLVLQTVWGTNSDGLIVPTQAVFLAGEDIITKRPNGKAHTLDNLEYYFRINTKEKIRLLNERPKRELNGPERMVFIRKPFEEWSADDPVPWALRKGIYYNVKFLQLISDKTSDTVNNFLKYMLQMVMGSAEGEKQGRVISKEDLKAGEKKLEELKSKAQTENGTPADVTPWDVKYEHLIPPYEQVLKSDLYTAVLRRILYGYGVLEIMRSSRQEDILNPKPMMAEIEQGMRDFTLFFEDIAREIRRRNIQKHSKFFKNNKISLWYPALRQEFLTRDLMEHIRSAYDRGDLSKESYAATLGINFEEEKKRRVQEIDGGVEELMYPHIIQNLEKDEPNPYAPSPKEEEETDPTKIGPEKVNYTNSEKVIEKAKKRAKEFLDYDESPYKNIKDLPKSVKVLPKEGQKLWLKTFNAVLKKYNDENKARKIAWFTVEKKFKKVKDKWVRKTKGSVEFVSWLGVIKPEMDVAQKRHLKLKEIELLEKKEGLYKELGKLLEESKGEENENS